MQHSLCYMHTIPKDKIISVNFLSFNQVKQFCMYFILYFNRYVIVQKKKAISRLVCIGLFDKYLLTLCTVVYNELDLYFCAHTSVWGRLCDSVKTQPRSWDIHEHFNPQACSPKEYLEIQEIKAIFGTTQTELQTSAANAYQTGHRNSPFVPFPCQDQLVLAADSYHFLVLFPTTSTRLKCSRITI